MAIRELLEDALLEPEIGQTPRFRWHATPVGIAASGKRALRPAPLPLMTPSRKGCRWGST